MSTTTIVTSLDTRTGVLNKKLAAHLLRRASFRFTKEKVDQLANLTAAQAVNNLFNNAAPAPYMPRPLDWETTGDRDWIPQEDSFKDTLRRQYVSAWWLQNALLDPTAHHKTVFFLHTNFATSHVGLSITGGVRVFE